MTNDTVNENASGEKSIHERMCEIDIKIIALQYQLSELCGCMLKAGLDTNKIFVINDITLALTQARLQLNYYDEIIEDAKLQQQNPPLIIKPEEKE